MKKYKLITSSEGYTKETTHKIKKYSDYVEFLQQLSELKNWNINYKVIEMEVK